MKVSIVGTGYVGLVSGVCLAEKGHEVVCVDVDQAKVDRINRGETPIYEKGLQDLLRGNLNQRFRATTDLRGAILGTDITMIAVGTPFDGDEIDLRFIREAAAQIGNVLKDKPSYHVVLVKSTVVPGTTDGVVKPIVEKSSGKKAGPDFGVGMNPEFLREGEAVQDFLFPDRIVLGGMDDRTVDVLEELYRPFPGVDKLRTNPSTAEAIKYTANSLLATMISFANEIANLCSGIDGVDAIEVMRGVTLDKRFSPILTSGQRITPEFIQYLWGGPGFGGSCFPKDVRALISYGKKIGCPMRILESIMEVNNAQSGKVLSLLRAHYPVLAGVRVTVLGLAFKPGTDDVRESAAIKVAQDLLAQKAVVRVFDPIARYEAQKILGGSVTYADTLTDAINEAQAVILMTRWAVFEEVPRKLSALAQPPVLIDSRRMFDKHCVPRYEGIGLSKSERSGVLRESPGAVAGRKGEPAPAMV